MCDVQKLSGEKGIQKGEMGKLFQKLLGQGVT